MPAGSVSDPDGHSSPVALGALVSAQPGPRGAQPLAAPPASQEAAHAAKTRTGNPASKAFGAGLSSPLMLMI
ncbi:hypothetical protein PtB15_17B323 [Puccinia triticina]|nr:hypothetical protein PtB15_17B323 [Puccinia triticina]